VAIIAGYHTKGGYFFYAKKMAVFIKLRDFSGNR